MADLPPFSEALEPLLAYSVLRGPPADPASFRRLVGPAGRLGPLTAACFLLYRQPERPAQEIEKEKANEKQLLPPLGGVEHFVLYTAPVLLGQLNRTTQSRRVTLYGRTRGKVDWSATYKARYSADSNPTVFVCQQSWRRFDRPENQLFVYLLKAVRDCLLRVPRWLWDWQAWGVDRSGEALVSPPLEMEPAGAEVAEASPALGQAPLVIGDFFAVLAHRLRVYRGHISLQEIPIPHQITTPHLLAATTSKNELYAELADFYNFYQAVVGFPEWESWAWVLSHTLPMPESAAEIGEYLRQETL